MHASRLTPDYESGFTLVEVIVAFAITAISLAVLLETFSVGLVATQRMAKKSEAIMLARSKLDAHSVWREGKTIGVGGQSGKEGIFSWSVRARAHHAYRQAAWLEVKVKWPGGRSRKKHSVSLLTLEMNAK